MRSAPLGSVGPHRQHQSLGAVLHDTRGSVTAEFAVTLPAVVALVALCIGGIGLAAHQLRLTSLAADLVRVEARGEGSPSTTNTLGTGVVVSRTVADGILCVRLASNPGAGVLSAITIRSQACALRSID